MILRNITQQTVLATRAARADTPASRLKGLLGRGSIDPDEALVISDCRSIHMMFMRFAIDVVFTDRNGTVVGCVERIPPFRLSPYFWRAFFAIELPPGRIAESRTRRGDRIECSA